MLRLKRLNPGRKPITADDLARIRRRYADELMAMVGADLPRLRNAFAKVPREAYLMPPPWRILPGKALIGTTTSNPAELYRNALVVIDAARGINNGEPALHAAWLAAVAPEPGETACHIGAGTGYYTAILAELVGPKGRVEAFEIEADLAARAKANLARRRNVTVHAGDAAAAPLPACDILYVNAAVAAPPLAWLNALKPGGRLVFPWRPSSEVALAILVTRADGGFAARPLMGAWFIPLAGLAGGAHASARLPEHDRARQVRSIVPLRERAPDASAIAEFDEVWFSSRNLER